MKEGLGLWLRRTREARNLSLEEAELALRIRYRYLQALEMGDYAALPGEIQTRGFLRNYARFLGLPVDEVTARYAAEVEGRPFQPLVRLNQDERQARFSERPTVFAPPPDEQIETDPPLIPRSVLQGLLGVLILFIVILVSSFIFLQVVENREPVNPISTPNSAETPVIEVGTPFLTPVFRPAPDGKIVARLEPQEHAWVSVSSDEKVIFQGIAAPGQPIQASAEELLIVSTGNGAAFRLYINGEDWGELGDQGQVVRRAWSPSGEVLLE